MTTLEKISYFLFMSRLNNKQMYNDIENINNRYTKAYQRGYADGWKCVIQEVERIIKESEDDKNGKVGAEESRD